MPRRRLAIGLFITAAVVAVLAYGSLWVSMGWPWGANHWLVSSGSHSGYRQVTASAVSRVVIAASGQAVQVSTAPGSVITVAWSSAGSPQRAVHLVRQGATVHISFQPPAAVVWSWSLFRQPSAVLDVALPPGLTLDTNVGSGSLSVTGVYRQVSAEVQAGTLHISHFQGALLASVGLGALGVEQATITGPLSLSTHTGVVDFWGDPGRQATITDNLGAVDLQLEPTGRLQVTVRVGLGSFTTAGFSQISGGAHSGIYSGTIGQGTAGSLLVTDAAGAVTMVPYRP